MTKRVSTDFTVGQKVVCVDPDQFISRVKNYLTGRIGIVDSVLPVEPPNKNYAGYTNRVRVVWQKKNGRGKEERMLMYPRDIKPLEEA